MSMWSGSQYQGETKEGWYHGKGQYTYANGVVYEGEFVKGEFHGDGTLIYPNVNVRSVREENIRRSGRTAKC